MQDLRLQNLLILENIRSAYNVGTMIRTADALWRKVICSGFSPDPREESKVLKSSLWAEQTVFLWSYRNPKDAIAYAKQQWYSLIASEITPHAIPLEQFQTSSFSWPIAIVMGSETDGVLPETLVACDAVVYIPMQGIKESLNVAEAAAIMMREISSKSKG
jgi:23S rRNA (guanosine2251-2'-O)-methyltransferase